MKPFYRFEFKYLVTPPTARSIESELKNFGMKLDAPSVLLGDGYYVTSLYFDSYDFRDYQDKCGGFKKRKKIRARIYELFLDKSSSVLLEIKKKIGERVEKTQLKLSREEWRQFMDKGVSALMSFEKHGPEKEVKDEIMRNIIASSARPQIIIRYKRKPYIASTSGALRVTFDSGLEACRKTDFNQNIFMAPIDEINKKGIILEVKSNYAVPQWLGRIIRDYNLKADAISKYAYGVEAVFRHNPLLR
ncbi:MAG: polyphosphate polymerase domain-containing protein [Candidatus Yanofskybacteria bacterium]|nr:polyphosphate polymerase domain-containing protein [Candidatus Yanofskybacteria bacterium]